ncbi:MAG: hypothetical protein QOJ23_2618 [Actinomycetota bacterium]|nr:hypothetical protein [Actinomycetota bacterium]
MNRPRVLILAAPYVYATALAACLRLEDSCDVVVPDLDGGTAPSRQRYDVVVTTAAAAAGALDGVAGDIVITLPAVSWATPILVRGAGETEPLLIDRAGSMGRLDSIVSHFVALAAQRSAPRQDRLPSAAVVSGVPTGAPTPPDRPTPQ